MIWHTLLSTTHEEIDRMRSTNRCTQLIAVTELSFPPNFYNRYSMPQLAPFLSLADAAVFPGFLDVGNGQQVPHLDARMTTSSFDNESWDPIVIRLFIAMILFSAILQLVVIVVGAAFEGQPTNRRRLRRQYNLPASVSSGLQVMSASVSQWRYRAPPPAIEITLPIHITRAQREAQVETNDLGISNGLHNPSEDVPFDDNAPPTALDPNFREAAVSAAAVTVFGGGDGDGGSGRTENHPPGEADLSDMQATEVDWEEEYDRETLYPISMHSSTSTFCPVTSRFPVPRA
ncbi:hypothetical protein MIND_00667900 [Mycena indigotica]|uniref:Uncharacterized protein n=1 Tax=Mycena indigotica TaxID=2126181 RepID=A0A8H6SKG0_9AGAR|nr:uncharacterized protein MIND_00667900 [Mycena indigotica]KAF7301041.1 hypothetical protein MIND_00667900 [Mycena indigotica]